MLYCSLLLLVLVRHHTLQKCCVVRYVYWFLSVTTHYRNVVLFATSTGSCPSPHIIEILCCSLRLLVLVRPTHYKNVVLFATSTGSCPSPHIIEMLYCSLRLLVLVRHHTLQKRCIVHYVYRFLSVTTHYRNVVLFSTSTGSCPSSHIIEMLCSSLRLLVLVRHHTLQKCCVVRYVYWFLSVITHYRNVVLFTTSTGSCPSPHIIEMLCCSLRLLVLVHHHTLQKCCIVRYVYWFLSVTTHYRNVVLFATSTGSCPSPHIIEMLYCSLPLLVLVRHHTLQKCYIVRYVYWFLSVTTHYRNDVLFATSIGSCPSPHIIEMLYCSLRLLVLLRHHTLQKCCIVRYVYWFLSVTTHYRNVILFSTSTGSCPSTHIIEMLYCSLRLLLLVRHHKLYKCCIVRYVYWFLSVTTHYRNVVLFATSTGSCPSPHIIEMLCCSQRLLVPVRHHTLQKYCVVRYVYWFLSVTTHYRNVVLFATSTDSCPSPHIIEMLYCSLRLLVLVRHHTLQKCCIVRYVYWFLSVTTHYRNVVLFATSTGSSPSPHIIEMLYCSLRLLVLVRHHTLQKCYIVLYVYWFLSVTTHYRNVVLFATSTGSCPSPHIIEMLYCSLRLLVLLRHHTLQKCCIVRYVYWFFSVTTHYRNVVLFPTSTGSCPSPHIIEMLCCSLRPLVLVRHHTLQKCCIVRYVYWFFSVTTHYRNVVLFATSIGSCPSPHIIEMLYCSLRLLVLVRQHTLQKCCIVRYVYCFLSVTTNYIKVVSFATSTGSCPSPHIIEMLCCSLRLLVLVRHHTLQKCCVVRHVYWFLSVTTHYRNIVLFATSTGSCPSPHIIEMLCCSLRLLVLVRHHTLQKCCIVRYVYWFLSVTTHYRNVVLFATSTDSCPSPHIIEMLYCSLRLLVLVRHHTLQKCCIVRYVYWFLSVTTHYRNVVLFATSTGSSPSPHIIEMLYCSLRLLVLVRHHTFQKCYIVLYVYWFLSVTTHYRNVVLFATSTGSCPSPHIIEMLYCSLRLLVLLRHHTLQKCCIVRYVYWFFSVTTHYRNVILFATSTGSCPSPHIIEMLCCSLRPLVLVRHHTLQKCCIVRYVYWFLSVTTHYRNVILFATSIGSSPSPHIIEMLYCSLRLLVLVRHHTLQKFYIVLYVYWFLSVTTHYRNVVLFATSIGSCPSPHIIEMLYCSLRLLVLLRHHTLQKCCIVRYVYWFLSVTTHYRNVILFSTSTGSCPSTHIIEMLYCSLRLLLLIRHHTLYKCCIVRYVYLFLSVTTHYRNVVLFATSTGSCPSPHIIEMLCCSQRLLVPVRHHTLQKYCVVRYVYWFLSVPHIIKMLCCSLRLLVLVRHHTLQKCCIVRYVYWFLSVTTHYRNVVLFTTSTDSCPSPHIIEMLYCSLRLLVLVRHHTLQKCCVLRYVYWFLSVITHYRNVVLFAMSIGSCPSSHIIEMLCCSLRLLVLVRHHTLQKCCVVRYVYWFLSITTHYRNVVLFATSTGSCPSPHIIEMLYCSLRLLVLVRHHTLQKCCIVRYLYWFLSVTTHYRNVILFDTSTGSCPSPHIIEMMYCSLRLLVLVRHHTLQKCYIVRYVYWFFSVTTHYRNVVLFATSIGSCPSPHIIEMLYCSLRLLVLVRQHTLQKCCIVRYVYCFLSYTTNYINVVLFATSTGSCPSPHIIEMLCCSLRLLVLVRHHTLQKCCVVRNVNWFLSVTTHYRNIVLFATSTGSCPSPHIIEMLCCSLRLLVLVRHHTLQKCCIVRYVYWFLSVTTHYRNVVLFATSTDSCPSPHIIEMLYCSLRLLVLVRHHTLQKCCIVRYVYWFLSVTTHYRNVVLFATSTGSSPSPHIIEMLYCSLRLLVLVRHHTFQKCYIVLYVYCFLSVTTHYRNVVLFATSTGSCPSPHIIEMLYCSLRLLVLLRHHTLQKCCIVRYVYWFFSVTTHYRNVVLFPTSTGSCPSPHIIEMLCCSLRPLVLVRHHTLQKCCIVRYVYWFFSVTTHYRNVVLFATSIGSCPSPHITEILYCSLRLLVLVRHHTLQKCCIVRYVYWFLSVTTHYRNVILFATSTGSSPSPHIIEMLYCSLRLLVLVVTTHYRNVILFSTSTGSCPSTHIIEMLYCSLRLLLLIRHHTLYKCCIVRYVYWFLSVTTHYRNVVLFATSTGSCPSPHIIEMLCCSQRLLVPVRHHTLQKYCVVRYVYWFLSVTTHYKNVVLFATSTGSCPSPHIIEMLYCSLRLLVLVRHHTLQKRCIVRYVCRFLSVTTHYRNVVLFSTSTGSCSSPHIIEMLYCSLRLLVLVRHHTLQKCCIVRYVYQFLSVTTHYRNVVLFATSTGSCPSPHILEMLYCSLRLLVLVRHHTLQKCCIVRYVYWFFSVTTHYRNVVLFATSIGSCPSPHIIEMLYCSLRLLVLVRQHTLQKCCIVRYVYCFLSVTTHYINVVLFATSTGSCPSSHIIEMLCCSLRLLVLVRQHTLQKCCIVRYVYWFLSVTTHYRNVILFSTSTGSCPSTHIIEMLYCSLRLLLLVRHHTLQKCCIVRYVYWFLSVTTHYRNVVLFATSTGSCPSTHIIEMLYCSLRLLVLVRHHTLQKCYIVLYVYWFLSVNTHYRNVVLFATFTGSCPSPHII